MAETDFKRPQAYVVELSNKTTVKVDADELIRVTKGIEEGSMIRVRQGIINPSFIVSIVEDKERIVEFLEGLKFTSSQEYQLRKAKGLTSLKDIFKDRFKNTNLLEGAKAPKPKELE